jgi:hypothetical protein
MLPNRLDVVQRVHRNNPGLIRNAHAFTNAVAYELWLEDQSWGHNVKRGTQGLSEDAICKLDNSSPLKVRVSTSPNNGHGIYVVDIIGSAGSANASPAWIDQTTTTLNQGTTADWSKPIAVATGHNPEPVRPPVANQPPVNSGCGFQVCNNSEVLAELRSLRQRVDELAAHFDGIGARLIVDVNR